MKKLEKAIAERGSIRSLADKLDLNPSTMSRWFAEDRSPDFRGLAIILEYFGVQIVFPGETTSQSETNENNLRSENLILRDKLAEIEEHHSNLREELLRKEGAIGILKEQIQELRNQDAPQGQIKNVNSGYQRGVTQEILVTPKPK